MAKIGGNGYRDGIEKMAEDLRSRASNKTIVDASAGRKQASKPPSETQELSPDYVVEMSSLKERAQKLIDSGMFSGDDIAFLKGVTEGKDL